MSFIIMILILCTGCDGDVTRELRRDGFQDSEKKFICSPFFPANKEDVNYEKVKFMTANHIVNQDGKLYEYSASNQFSSSENCREAQVYFSVKAIMDGNVAKGFDNKYYALTASSNNQSLYSEIRSNDNNYLIYQLLLQDDSVVKVTTVDSGNGLYYILLTDGNVYSYTIKRDDRNAPPTISGTSIVYNKSTFGERIIDYNYAGDSSTTYIKLESGRIFRMVATNLKECSKYIDIPCQYELVEDEALFKNKDRIIAYNGNSLITDYHKYFSMSGK